MQTRASFTNIPNTKLLITTNTLKKAQSQSHLQFTHHFTHKSKSSRSKPRFNRNLRLPPIQSDLRLGNQSQKLEMYPNSTVYRLGNTSNLALNSIKTPVYGLIPSKDPVNRWFCRSEPGTSSNLTKNNNQDCFLAERKTLDSSYLFAVFDGHGENGKEVAGLAANSLKRMMKGFKIFGSVDEIIKESFAQMDLEIAGQGFSEFSGCTALAVLIKGNEIWCSNVGNSRAIIAGFDLNWFIYPLSLDHVPSVKKEAKRIINNGGRIKDVENDSNLRIWLADEDVPGLGLTRSLGDSGCKSIGVISKPDIKRYEISNHDRFMILATDGIWQFISNQEAVDLVIKTVKEGKQDEVCDVLIEEATRRWKLNCESTDDITILVIFFNNIN